MLVLEGLVGLHTTIQLQLLQHYTQGIDLITVILNGLPETVIILSFLRLHKVLHFGLFVDNDGSSISSKGFLPTVVDITKIAFFLRIIKSQ